MNLLFTLSRGSAETVGASFFHARETVAALIPLIAGARAALWSEGVLCECAHCCAKVGPEARVESVETHERGVIFVECPACCGNASGRRHLYHQLPRDELDDDPHRWVVIPPTEHGRYGLLRTVVAVVAALKEKGAPLSESALEKTNIDVVDYDLFSGS